MYDFHITLTSNTLCKHSIGMSEENLVPKQKTVDPWPVAISSTVSYCKYIKKSSEFKA